MSDTTGVHRKSYQAIDPDAPIYAQDRVQRRIEWVYLISAILVGSLLITVATVNVLRWWMS
jgi:hypothetical protein